jgi:hypothetical protein
MSGAACQEQHVRSSMSGALDGEYFEQGEHEIGMRFVPVDLLLVYAAARLFETKKGEALGYGPGAERTTS